MKTLKKILLLLSSSERKQAVTLLGMMMVMAFFDMLGVASILPFISVLANPDVVQSNVFLNTAYTASLQMGIQTTEQFLFTLGGLVMVLLVISLAFKALTAFSQIKFALMREFSMGTRLVEGYLHQPYSWFLNHNSANLGGTILSEVGTVIGNGIIPLMTLVAQSLVSLLLLVLLMIVDPLLALSVGLLLGLSYLSIFIIVRNKLKNLGQSRSEANKARYTAVSEAFGAIKEVKLGGLEEKYIQLFAKPAEIYADRRAKAGLIAQLPRFAIEAIAFGGILLLILYLMANTGTFVDSLPIIALYAFAGYRLMPALQQIYSALTQLRFVSSALDALHKDLSTLQVADVQQDRLGQLQLGQAIKLNQVSYHYHNASQAALSGINLSIPVRSTIGFVGPTGSGKTTAVDVILGLLQPQEGTLEIDGQVINAVNLRQWQNTIGYVPQHIYLIDDSVANNIAFGVKAENIDHNAVERASKIANLHEFVINDLPQGYATTIGERGVRLSGGQRQRIGIARALYHNPQVLILDEATSALDNITEKVVMEAINNLSHNITIILIVHRFTTVRRCDQIYMFERGEVKAQGTFEELIKKNERFRAMAASQ